MIRAAGGVVWRRAERSGALEVLIVYRTVRDDWTFPKGKALAGERDEECALREVEEETGLRCALGVELPGTSYRDRKGRPKTVRYWIMRPLGGEPAAGGEVDAVCWASLKSARDILTNDRDLAVLAAFARGRTSRIAVA